MLCTTLKKTYITKMLEYKVDLNLKLKFVHVATYVCAS